MANNTVSELAVGLEDSITSNVSQHIILNYYGVKEHLQLLELEIGYRIGWAISEGLVKAIRTAKKMGTLILILKRYLLE